MKKSLRQYFSHLNMNTNHLEIMSKFSCGVRVSALTKNCQVIPVLLVYQPEFEKQGSS